jgi:hypothetical protein
MPNRSSTASRLQPYQKTDYPSLKVVGKTYPLMSEKEFDKFCQERIKRLKSGELFDFAYVQLNNYHNERI